MPMFKSMTGEYSQDELEDAYKCLLEAQEHMKNYSCSAPRSEVPDNIVYHEAILAVEKTANAFWKAIKGR